MIADEVDSPDADEHERSDHRDDGGADHVISSCLADRLIAPASRKLEEEAYEQTPVSAVVVHDGINPISSTVLLEPLWARSTHVMTFRVVTLDWLDHWRSPSTINCTENVSTGNTD
jgi:hypothetical protein